MREDDGSNVCGLHLIGNGNTGIDDNPEAGLPST